MRPRTWPSASARIRATTSKHLFNVSLNVRGLMSLPAQLKPQNFPARGWLVHISRCVCATPSGGRTCRRTKAIGLLLFATDLYQIANVYLAWAPLTPGQPPPPPGTWKFYMGKEAVPEWQTVDDVVAAVRTPARLITEHETIGMLGELFVSWSPALRRWIMTSEGVQIRFARKPQGPWKSDTRIFDGSHDSRTDNLAPDRASGGTGPP